MIALAAATAAVALVAPDAQATSGWYGSQYSRSTWCGSIRDPVGIVFHGSGAGGEYLPGQWYKSPVRPGHIWYHTGWGRHSGETTQFHNGQSGCVQNVDVQPASASPAFNSRFHMRLFWGYQTQAGSPAMLGTPHHEDWVATCGHAVDKGAVDRGAEWRTRNGSGFDWGRRKIWARFTKGRHRHAYEWAYWGNTKSVRQCDGDYAGSNGNVLYVKVGA